MVNGITGVRKAAMGPDTTLIAKFLAEHLIELTQSGVGIETIRYYEREGIVPKPARALNNRRLYSASNVGRLRFLKKCRDLGFPLSEAKALLELSEGTAEDCGLVKELAGTYIAGVRSKIEELRSLEYA